MQTQGDIPSAPLETIDSLKKSYYGNDAPVTPNENHYPSRNRIFIERIVKDSHAQKNQSNNMRMSYNPILEDLLEAKEREEENLKEATRFRQEVKDTL